MISINRLLKRKSNFLVNSWILDSGSFTRISSKKGHLSTKKYSKYCERWAKNGVLEAVVTQDYPCDPESLIATGLDIPNHQSLTIHRYKKLLSLVNENIYVMPVLQGWSSSDYVNHLYDYGDYIKPNSWVGVGTLCSRSKSINCVKNILLSLKKERPDINLHGFGVKKYCLQDEEIKNALFSADSSAHSFGKGKYSKMSDLRNDPQNALNYYKSIGL